MTKTQASRNTLCEAETDSLFLGEMIYENSTSGERWFTAFDPEGKLYFYSIDPDTLETRSEWSLPGAPGSPETRDKVGTICHISLVTLTYTKLQSNPRLD